ncbi:hypothetical protein VNO80_13326 [Phaseolus coccineus]|uniref:Leucine-rich repeat-containing N-terminal plant-type domain-containing protein n=1 Tax=Phaseolus coccineus TaxID=3886 RepID=A0AAN9N0S1_PHACN
MLSSWTTTNDCCQWKGICCSNLTGNIISLDLHNEYDYETSSRSSISGEMHESLIELQELKYLNLSWNSFPDSHIPEFLASLNNLRFLDLSWCEFGRKIPKVFLGGSYDGVLEINGGGKLLSNLISLTHPYLWSIRGLNSSHTWLQEIVNLPKLRELSLFDCSLFDHFILSLRPYQFDFSTSLLAFHLSWNTFTSPVIFPRVSNITSNLVELHFAGNNLEGSISNHFGMAMNSLKDLDLSFNSFKEGGIPKSFGNACALGTLDMKKNNLSDEFSMIIDHLSGCARYSLQELNLSGNQINGPTFPKWLQTQNNFVDLDISNAEISDMVPRWFSAKLALRINSRNQLVGSIPPSLDQIDGLAMLDLSHHLSGVIPSGT